MSKSVQLLNPHLTGMPVERPWNARGDVLEPKTPIRTGKPMRHEKQPNKTEARFRDWWESLRAFSKLDYSPITLRIGLRRYTPDWVFFGVGGDDERIQLIEVKGPWIEEDAAVKFDLFKSHFTGFDFAMWQENSEGLWVQIR